MRQRLWDIRWGFQFDISGSPAAGTDDQTGKLGPSTNILAYTDGDVERVGAADRAWLSAASGQTGWFTVQTSPVPKPDTAAIQTSSAGTQSAIAQLTAIDSTTAGTHSVPAP